MKHILPITIIFTLVLSGCASTLSQNNSDPVDPKKLYSPEELKEDLDYLFQTMEDVHPNLYAFVLKDTIDANRKQIFEILSKPMTAMEFWMLVRPIVSKIGDGHTNLFYPYKFRKAYLDNGGLIVPFDVYIENGRLFIENNHSLDSALSVNSEILSINGISTNEVIDLMAKYESGERIENRYNRIKRNFRPLIWSLYHLENEFDVHFISATDGNTYSKKLNGITLETLTSFFNENKKTEYKPYSFNFIENYVGLIDFKSFRDLKKFKKFLKKTFSQIQEKNIQYLIIDIRQNGGGSSRLGDALFSYITNKPYTQAVRMDIKSSKAAKKIIKDQYIKWYLYPIFPLAFIFKQGRAIFTKPDGFITKMEIDENQPKRNPLRFDGDVYLLTGPKTFSSATLFATAFKCYEMGTVVGEETGGVTVAYGEALTFYLPNTKLIASVSLKKFFHPCGKEDGHGVIPDYEVKQTPEDREKGIDTVLEFTKELIKKNEK